MILDYYSLLTKAVKGKDVNARDRIYRNAHKVIDESNLAPEAASQHINALEDAIRQIENDLLAGQQRPEPSAAAVRSVLSPGRNWKPFAVTAFALVTVIAISAFLYVYVSTTAPHMTGGGSAPWRQSQRAAEEAVMPDLKPGVDGGSSGAGLPFAMQRQVVFYRTTIVPGSIVVDRENRFLYLIHSNNSARRYGIGIALECLTGGSLFRVTNKLEWPARRGSTEAAKETATLLQAGGTPGSPLGARALLLDKPGLLIHGTNTPNTIGHLVASGCIRLVNEDVEDLYRRVSLESRVVFVS
jgi:lipoprotein-anchoring transpeptidase ErfK/SrfK